MEEESSVDCCFPFEVFVISLIPQIVLKMVKRWEGISLKTVSKTKGVAASRRREVTFELLLFVSCDTEKTKFVIC